MDTKVTQEQQKHFERPTSHAQEFPMVKRIVYLVLIVGLGIITGASGFLIAYSQLPSTQPTPYPFGITVNQLQPQSAGRTVYDATTIARSQTVSIIKQRSRTRDQYDQLIDPAEYIGSGVIATSDGWVMTSIPAVQLSKIEVEIRGSIYEAQKVSTDLLTGISFLKTNIRLSTPVNIGSAVDAGDMLVAVGAASGAVPRPVVARVLHSSDSLGEYTLIEAPLEQGAAQAYFTGDGKFAGFSIAKGTDVVLLPPAIIRLALEQGLSQDSSKDLGIYYIVNNPTSVNESSESITVFHPTHPAVRAGSLAAKAGLHKGDTITSIGGELITQDASFDYLWKKHSQDTDGVQLVIVRNGVEGPVQIVW
jgi:S1-C subfamily serine protease